MSEVTSLRSEGTLGYRIPSGWTLREMGGLGEVKTGLTYKPEDVAHHGTLVLRSSNVQEERLAFEDNVFVSKKVGDGATVREGDILICVRNGSRRLIGKSALITAEADGMAFGAFMSAFRSELNPYLIWVFQSDIIQRQIEENLGATINQITNATLRALKVPVPPPHEQQAIAAALSDADGVVAWLERVIAKKRLIKQGAMQDLLTARRRLPGFSGEWEVKKMGELLANVTGGGTPSRTRAEFWNGPIPWMTVKDFATGSIRGTLESITTEGLKNSASSLVDAGTLILCTRMAVGKTAIMDVDVAINQDLKALVFKPGISSVFVKRMFELMQKQIEDSAGGSTVKGISIGDVRAMEFPLPSTDEQDAIATVLSDMDSEIQTLESRLAKARAVKEGMMQNLLTGRVRLV